MWNSFPVRDVTLSLITIYEKSADVLLCTIDRASMILDLLFYQIAT
jgi:hypothetical protein